MINARGLVRRLVVACRMLFLRFYQLGSGGVSCRPRADPRAI